MDWNALTGMEIGALIEKDPPLVKTPELTRNMTFVSGCAVPICDVPLYESSTFPAAAGTPLYEKFFNVCDP